MNKLCRDCRYCLDVIKRDPFWDRCEHPDVPLSDPATGERARVSLARASYGTYSKCGPGANLFESKLPAAVVDSTFTVDDLLEPLPPPPPAMRRKLLARLQGWLYKKLN